LKYSLILFYLYDICTTFAQHDRKLTILRVFFPLKLND